MTDRNRAKAIVRKAYKMGDAINEAKTLSEKRKIQKARDQFIIQNKDIILAELNAQIMDTIDLPSDC